MLFPFPALPTFPSKTFPPASGVPGQSPSETNLPEGPIRNCAIL